MRTALRVLKWLSLTTLGLILILLLILLLEGGARKVELSEQNKASITAPKSYNAKVDSSHYYDLLNTYGKNKNLPNGFEYQSLLALSHYPELKDTRIDFVIKPTFLPLASRPDPKSLLLPWVKRKYLVVISNASTDFFEPILLENTPFDEQVGIVGHELAHTVYYQDKTAFQLIRIAYCYQNDNNYRIAFERETDKRAVAHGLGYQLYDFAFFVRKAFGDTQEEIEAEEGDMYLSPKELAREMEQYSFYRDTLDAPARYFAD